MKIEKPSFPLTKKLFVAALRTGHGRAFQQVDSCGVGGLEGEIIEACLTSLVYDTQIEEDRAPWLALLVQRTGLESKVLAEIESLLQKPTDDNYNDLAQRSGVLKALAVVGSEAARHLLYQSLARLPRSSEVIADEKIVELDGLEGMVHVARRLGQWLQDDPDFWVSDFLIKHCDAVVGGEGTLSALQAAAVHEPEIAKYLQCVSINQAQRDHYVSPWEKLWSYTGQQVLEYVLKNPSGQYRWLRGWGRHTAPDQRGDVFAALLATSDPEFAKRLL